MSDEIMPQKLPDLRTVSNDELLDMYVFASDYADHASRTVKQMKAWSKRRDELKKAVLERMVQP